MSSLSYLTMPWGRSLRKELADIGERLELKRIPRRIEKEHRRLLAHLAFKADVWLDHKLNASTSKPLSQRLPSLHWEYHAEVRDRNIVSIDSIMVSLTVRGARFQMRDDLVAEEIEVDPLRRTAPLRATEGRSIKRASGV